MSATSPRCMVKNAPHGISQKSVVLIASASTFDPSIGILYQNYRPRPKWVGKVCLHSVHHFSKGFSFGCGVDLWKVKSTWPCGFQYCLIDKAREFGGPEAIFLPRGLEVLQWPWLPACFFSQIWGGRSNVWPWHTWPAPRLCGSLWSASGWRETWHTNLKKFVFCTFWCEKNEFWHISLCPGQIFRTLKRCWRCAWVANARRSRCWTFGLRSWKSCSTPTAPPSVRSLRTDGNSELFGGSSWLLNLLVI